MFSASTPQDIDGRPANAESFLNLEMIMDTFIVFTVSTALGNGRTEREPDRPTLVTYHDSNPLGAIPLSKHAYASHMLSHDKTL